MSFSRPELQGAASQPSEVEMNVRRRNVKHVQSKDAPVRGSLTGEQNQQASAAAHIRNFRQTVAPPGDFEDQPWSHNQDASTDMPAVHGSSCETEEGALIYL